MLGNIHNRANVDARAIVHPLAVVEEGVTLDEGVVVHAFAVVGGSPQHFRDSGAGATLRVGPRTVIREYVTLNRGTKAGTGRTIVGRDCLFMATAHVGHDCVVGDGVILTNGAVLAGHCEIGDFVVLGGQSGVHQFCRIGTMSMVAGGSGVSQDIPPYCMVAGFRARMVGLNEVGLDRHGVCDVAIQALRKAYRTIFRRGLPRAEALRKAREEQGDIKEVVHFVDFIAAAAKRGVVRHGRE